MIGEKLLRIGGLLGLNISKEHFKVKFLKEKMGEFDDHRFRKNSYPIPRKQAHRLGHI